MSLVLAGVGYRYPSAEAPAVAGVDLTVEPGQVTLLTGRTGCGKSTLLRLAAGLASRHGGGEATGEVRVSGVDPAGVPPAHRVSLVGFVAQEPRDQLVAGTVADEVAFAMESAAWQPSRMAVRIPEILDAVGLDVGLDRATTALSGGQIQRLVLAAAIGVGATLVLLDEPIAQLDPAGARDLLAGLRRLADRRGVAVLIAEHRLEPVLEVADRLVVLDRGAVVWSGRADEVVAGAGVVAELRGRGLALPGLVDLADRVELDGFEPPVVDRPAPPLGAPVLTARGLSHTWPGGVTALRGVDLTVRAGERVAILGGNGAGKSTLLTQLVDSARVERGGRVVMVPQDPDLALFSPTVRAEVAHGPLEQAAADVDTRVERAAEALGIADLLDRRPHALSRGQRLRVAVAAAVSCEPAVLLLDEPTAGQHRAEIDRMAAGLVGRTVVFATHDVELALHHATRVVVLHEGRVVRDAPPAEALVDLPPEVPIRIPPLARWCLDHGVPPASAAELTEGGAP